MAYNIEAYAKAGSVYQKLYFDTRWAQILDPPLTYVAASHTHGSITNDGYLGVTSGKVAVTSTDGKLEAKAAGTTSQYLRGDGSWAVPVGSTTPTGSSWTAGTTAGPVIKINGTAGVAIPSANGTSASGIVTTTTQTFGGTKTFTLAPKISTLIAGRLVVSGTGGILENLGSPSIEGQVLTALSGDIGWAMPEGGGATYSAMNTTTLGLGKVSYDAGSTYSTQSRSTTSTKYYGVEMDANDKLRVNVPWSNTTYSIMSATTSGLGRLYNATVVSTTPQAISTTSDRYYGIQKNSTGQLMVNVPWTSGSGLPPIFIRYWQTTQPTYAEADYDDIWYNPNTGIVKINNSIDGWSGWNFEGEIYERDAYINKYYKYTEGAGLTPIGEKIPLPRVYTKSGYALGTTYTASNGRLSKGWYKFVITFEIDASNFERIECDYEVGETASSEYTGQFIKYFSSAGDWVIVSLKVADYGTTQSSITTTNVLNWNNLSVSYAYLEVYKL